MMDLWFWLPVLVGGLLAGGTSGLLGTHIVGMRIPFLAVCVAHAALAGAVFGELAGLPSDWAMLPALAAAILAALGVAWFDPERLRLDPNLVVGLLFSASMGLAFLGIGLFSAAGRSDSHVRSLLWGSLSFCRWRDVAWMGGVAIALGLFTIAFNKELRALLFSRQEAAALGIATTLVWSLFLVLTAAALTVNLQSVGGLMIYSLITNPAAAAMQWTCGYTRVLLLSIALGAISAVGGFVIAAFTDLPSGAVIVLFSSGLVVCALVSRRRATRV
jgi:manganese/iron transport system permease protein